MDLQFQKTACPCMDRLMCQVRSTEQTQELRLSDGMPDIGRVLAAWGQPVLRSKEWHRDALTLTGGILMWVLYAPEDGTEARCVDSWLPFQMTLELPENSPEGSLRVQLLPKFSDARSLSARKLMLRSGAAALVEAWVPETREVLDAQQVPGELEVLRQTYPVRLPRQTGEKTFLLDEDLTMPGSAPTPEKLIYYTLRPEITDQKVTGDKAVFRGNGNLHILYRSEEGQLHGWDFPLPFSQLASLDRRYGTDAGVDVMLCPTSLELELDAQGHLRLKCAMAAQYLVDERQMIQVLADAYSPGRQVRLQTQDLTLPVVLENRRENLYAEQMLPISMNLAADILFLPDFPRLYPLGDGVRMEIPGTFQALYYDENGMLQGTSGRWEGSQQLPADENSRLSAVPVPASPPQLSLSEGAVTLKSEVPLNVTATARQQIPMITQVTVGEATQPDPNRPSLILQRAEGDSLWQIARENGSTMDAIRRANGISDDPLPGQMLLIPIA